MILFATAYVRRRIVQEVVRGASHGSYTDSFVEADVQRNSESTSGQTEGSRKSKGLKAWSDELFRTDDQLTGEMADWIWKDGHWYKCLSCERSNNTMLDHYVSTFERVTEAANPDWAVPPETGGES